MSYRPIPRPEPHQRRSMVQQAALVTMALLPVIAALLVTVVMTAYDPITALLAGALLVGMIVAAEGDPYFATMGSLALIAGSITFAIYHIP